MVVLLVVAATFGRESTLLGAAIEIPFCRPRGAGGGVPRWRTTGDYTPSSRSGTRERCSEGVPLFWSRLVAARQADFPSHISLL